MMMYDSRTPFTGVARYTYVDPDYSFSPKELGDCKNHKQSYIAYNRKLQTQRGWKEQEKYEYLPLLSWKIVVARGVQSY